MKILRYIEISLKWFGYSLISSAILFAIECIVKSDFLEKNLVPSASSLALGIIAVYLSMVTLNLSAIATAKDKIKKLSDIDEKDKKILLDFDNIYLSLKRNVALSEILLAIILIASTLSNGSLGHIWQSLFRIITVSSLLFLIIMVLENLLGLINLQKDFIDRID